MHGMLWLRKKKPTFPFLFDSVPEGGQEMLRKISLCAVLVMISVILASCGSSGTETTSDTNDTATVTVTEKDNNSSVDLSVGDILVVELKGNPSTGFQWQQIEPDAAIVRQMGEPEFKPDSSALGSPGKVDLRFEAVGSGEMELQLAYQRPFEPQTPAANTFNINVTVK
jgi:inhibitor of cysteine peptidase